MAISLQILVDNLSVIYKKECKSCKERKIVDYKKKEMIPLTDEKTKSCEK